MKQKATLKDAENLNQLKDGGCTNKRPGTMVRMTSPELKAFRTRGSGKPTVAPKQSTLGRDY